VAIALDELRLDPTRAQRAREIAARAEGAILAVTAARQEFVDVLATALENNDYDGARSEDAAARLVKAVDTCAPELARAMGELHALLTPGERATLVDRAHMEWPRWELRWRVFPNDDDVAVGGPSGGIATLAVNVGLRQDQYEYVARELRRRRVLYAYQDRDRVFDRFAEASFDTASPELSSYWVGLAVRTAHRARIVVETMVPVLDREQRMALAHLLRASQP
jgi:hypothetical protein